MSFIAKQTWQKNGVEVIIFNEKKWLNEKHMEVQLQYSNLPHITNQYSSELKKERQKLQNCGKYQPCRKFLREDFAIQVILDCRTTPAVSFKTRLWLNQHDPIMTQEQSILTKIRSIFPNETLTFQYHVLNYGMDAYLPKHKLAIEIDELGHVDIINDHERQLAIEKELDCKFIRINPAKERFKVFNEIGIIQIFIAESNKELTGKSTKESTKESIEKSMIDRLSIRLLELEFKSNNSIKVKCLKYIVKTILPEFY